MCPGPTSAIVEAWIILAWRSESNRQVGRKTGDAGNAAPGALVAPDLLQTSLLGGRPEFLGPPVVLMKKLVFFAALALGVLPLTAKAFGGHMGGGHLGMGPRGSSRPAFGHDFRDPGRGFAFRHDGRFDGRAFAPDGRFFRDRRAFFLRHHRRFFRSDFAFIGFGFPYPYDPFYPFYPYPYIPYYPYSYYPY